jgi:hypothetical protein
VVRDIGGRPHLVAPWDWRSAGVILGIHQRETIYSLVYGIRRVYRKISLAVIFMNRAVNPMTFLFWEERTSLEVGELCACKLLCKHCYWTREVPTGEITDEVKAATRA